MIKALYSVNMTFKCVDNKVLEEVLMELHYMAGMYRLEHTYLTEDDHEVSISAFEDYNHATKMHYKVKELLVKYNETGLTKYPLI